jgi:flagellin-like hook-associated protein FlgL
MTDNISLSSSVRQNLLALQDTSNLMQTTQNRLATGKKVNSALDNPLNFFTSSSLNSRAKDLSGLIDAMSSGIQTIQAANNGLTAITSLTQQLKATVSQARSDATAATVTPGTALTPTTATNSSNALNTNLTFVLSTGVSAAINVNPGTTAATLTGTTTAALGAAQGGTINITSADVNGGAAVAVVLANNDTLATAVTKINTALGAGASVKASQNVAGNLVLTSVTGNNITVSDAVGNAAGTTAGLGLTNGKSSTNGVVGTPLTVDQIVAAVNGNSAINTQVKASKTAGGFLSLQNQTTSAITVNGITTAAVTGVATDTQTLAAGTGGGLSNVRQSLMTQFNDLRNQIDKVAGDSGFNGVNLLNSDSLKLSFNETGTSSITVQTKDSAGNALTISSSNLGVAAGTSTVFADNTQLDTLTATLSTALTTLRTQASSLGSSLSVVQTRQDFTKSMINTLQTGADNLVLADTNQEGANLLALQTRQSLSSTALSLSAQSDRAVLRLFGG